MPLIRTLYGVANPGKPSPSAARTLSSSEVYDLQTVAAALPSGWVVTLQPPYGQLTIEPAVGRRRFHRCWVGSIDLRRLFRDSGLA